jgi:hypothetical protein
VPSHAAELDSLNTIYNYQKKYFLDTDSAVAQGYGGQVHGFSLVSGEWMLDT